MIRFLPWQFDDVWYWPGATAYLVLCSDNDWIDEDGNPHLTGEIRDKHSPHKVFAGVVNGASLLFENVSFPPTTTSPDRPRTRISAAIYDSGLRFRLVLFEGWVLPDGLNPLTFAALTNHNAACACGLDDVKFYNRAQVDFQIQEAIDNILLANMPTVTGLAAMVDGVVAVAEPLVTAFSRIVPTSMSAGVIGGLYVDAAEIVPGVSFTIRSPNPGDNGNVAWSITEP